MMRNPHERAQELIVLAGAYDNGARDNDKDFSAGQQAWLRTHLQECEACRDYAEAAGRVVRAWRSRPLTADSALVRATQMRVRSRSLQLRRRQERLWVVWVCCLAVTLGSAFTTAMLWGGFAWIGQQSRLSGPVWQIALLEFSLVPAIVTAILLLSRGTCLADHHGSHRD